MNRSRPALRKMTVTAAVFAVLCSSAVLACQVPVFRFALERWAADQYEIIVLHDGPMDAKDSGRLDRLRQSDHKSPLSANFQARAIDIQKTKDPELQALWKKNAKGGSPLMLSLYPTGAHEVPDRVVDVTRFDDPSLENLIDSPVRRELVKRLTDGDSAVWIFVPSGHADQDKAAFKMLTAQVKRNGEQLELPPQDEIEADEFFSEETNIELRLSFSIVTLNREDPREKYLLNMLLESEPDLRDLDQPMAFPVLGRGRVLYALVGKGIFEDTIALASKFIVGPCSCQVKEQNPGFDLLLAVDWDEKVGVNALSKPLPEKKTKPVLVEIPAGKK